MTFERWNQREETKDENNVPFTESSFDDEWGKASKLCSCGERTVVVWYLDDNILALCERCATGIALGILRDLAEAKFGKAVADFRYKLTRERLLVNRKAP